MDFAFPVDRRVKMKKIQKQDKFLHLARERKIHEGDGDAKCNWCTWNCP